MKFKDIGKAIEKWAPPALAESYDNVGLLVGEPHTECTGVLVNLDVTEALIDEAVEKGLNLIVTHHPIWFGGRKRLNGEDYVSRIILKAVRSGVGLYACHTNLDNVRHGVNKMIGDKLGMIEVKTLAPKKGLMMRMTVFVPKGFRDAVQEALFTAGAGQVGHYDQASFISQGTGTFRPLEGSNPTVGETGKRAVEEEAAIEVVLPAYQKGAVVGAMLAAHPYELPAYQIWPIGNVSEDIGSGMVGELPEPMSKADFLAHVRDTFNCGGIRYADFPGEKIARVAWCGGSGSFLTQAAIRSGADAFVTGDITYHKYFDNEDRILLLDIGHYESEQYTSHLICSYLSEKFPTFAVHLSVLNTNPVKYY